MSTDKWSRLRNELDQLGQQFVATENTVAEGTVSAVLNIMDRIEEEAKSEK